MDTVVFREGHLPSGLHWRVVYSAQVIVQYGWHLVLTCDIEEPDPKDRSELFGTLYDLGLEVWHPGRFFVTVNGPTLRTRPEFHAHLFFLDAHDPIPTA